MSFFVDSVRDTFKYSLKNMENKESPYTGTPVYYQDQMRLFRAQRNLYISGFSVFCLFIIRQVAALISKQAFLQIQAQILKKQALNISETALNAEAKVCSQNDEEKKSLKAQLSEMAKENSKYKIQVQMLTKQVYTFKRQAEYNGWSEDYGELEDDCLSQSIDYDDE